LPVVSIQYEYCSELFGGRGHDMVDAGCQAADREDAIPPSEAYLIRSSFVLAWNDGWLPAGKSFR